MLTRNDLLPYKDITGFNLGQIEKDYVQHLFLMNFYRRISNELVFKGGTALQKTYGLNRFSEDLDFTLSKKIEFTTIIDKALTGMNIFGCKATKKKIKEDEMSITFQVRAKGPLYDGTDKSLTYINLEVSKKGRSITVTSNE
ncbi:MAG: nucleotidyl transferase AbiEii/AbiGii toxin family protein [Asgard group archaeon]|nr:nucleotidyl transferase AbiEii/AbiGii toxin family protein [Asgard group archaeon]